MSDETVAGRRPQPHPDDEAYTAKHYPSGGDARQWGAEQPVAERPAMVPTATHPPVPAGADPDDDQPAPVPPTMSIDLAAAPAPYFEPPPPVPNTSTSTASEDVTCPECGAHQEVYLNRRDATDFCRRCDFPLFWTPSRVERDRAAASQGESLRRLPGTAGRTTLASAICPHCAEPNPVQAEFCIRCARSMHPVALPPVVEAPPPPPPAPVVPVIPDERVPWWVWALVGFFLVVAITLVVLVITGVIG